MQSLAESFQPVPRLGVSAILLGHFQRAFDVLRHEPKCTRPSDVLQLRARQRENRLRDDADGVAGEKSRREDQNRAQSHRDQPGECVRVHPAGGGRGDDDCGGRDHPEASAARRRNQLQEVTRVPRPAVRVRAPPRRKRRDLHQKTAGDVREKAGKVEGGGEDFQGPYEGNSVEHHQRPQHP